MFVRCLSRFSVLSLAWLSLLCGPLTRPLAAQDSCLEKLPAQGSRFGTRVSIDGDTLLVESSRGNAYVFHREDGVWALEQRIAQPNTFKGSAALSGERLLLGGRNVAPVVMRRDDGRWVREAVLSSGGGTSDSYGQYYALSGDLAAVSDHDAGRVHFFRREGERWIPDGLVQRANLFGWTIDLDGDVAVVGDFGAELNTAVVLRRSEEGGAVRWMTEAELRPSDGCDWFGADVAISGDVVLVGSAPDFARPDQPCGRAYVFRYAPDEIEWVEEQILAPEGVVPRDRFGASVSVSGDVAVIGAMGDSQFEGGSGFGTVYAYFYDGSEWVQTATVEPADQRQNDWFARAVAVSGKTIVIGADNVNGGAGAAYTFTVGPRATFTVTPEEPTVGEEVTFDASATSSEDGVAAYRWNLGGGAAAEGSVVTHSYTEPGRFLVSVAASDDNGGCGGASRMVTVTCPPDDVAPWTSGAVGLPAFPGAARFEGEGESRELVLCAGGDDIETASQPDEFHFVYREVTGEVVLTARISEMSDKPLAKAGLTLREGLEPGARHAAMVFENPGTAQGNGRFRFIHREERDGRARAQSSGRLPGPPAAWVRLRREGNEFIGLSSTDGETWTEVHRIILELPEALLAGVAAGGRDSGPDEPYSPLAARISHLTASPDPEPPVPAFRRGDANSDGNVDVADGVALLNFLFQSNSSPTCAGSADADDSGGLDISDVIYLFNFLFGGGPALPPPATECGVDPTPDGLACDGHAACP